MVSYRDLPIIFLRNGVGGIIITDHYSQYSFSMLMQSSFLAKLDYYFSVYHWLADECEKKGLKIMFGSEIALNNDLWQDFLIFGDIEKPFRRNFELYNYTQEELFYFCLDNNLLMFQAHPFRAGVTLSDVVNVHGLEVFNGNINTAGVCLRSMELCRKHDLMQIAGSDFHYPKNAGKAGVYLPQEAWTGNGFVEYYRKNTPELFF
jgi:hypothetical protein